MLLLITCKDGVKQVYHVNQETLKKKLLSEIKKNLDDYDEIGFSKLKRIVNNVFKKKEN